MLAVLLASCGPEPAERRDGGTDAGLRDAGRAAGDAGVRYERLEGALASPRDVIVTRGGEVLVTEFGAGRIVRRAGGAWEPVAEGLVSPVGVREAPDGALYVAEENAHAVTRIDPAAGSRVVIAGDLGNVTYLTLGPDGAIYVSSFRTTDRAGTGVVHRVDPASGTATPYVTGMHVPEGLAFDALGRLIVAEWTLPSAVLRFAVGGGAAEDAEVLSTDLTGIYGLALVDGEVWAADHAGRIAVVRSDGSSATVLAPIARPGGLYATTDAVWIAEFVDFGAIGAVIRVDR